MTHLYQKRLQVQGRLIRLLFVGITIWSIIIIVLFLEMVTAYETAQALEDRRIQEWEAVMH